MKAMRVGVRAGLESLSRIERDVRRPEAAEILVRIRASSLNYHDYGVVTGRIAVEEGRIPMSDGAGEVIEIGSDVTAFAVGDRVVSTFFPNWFDGEATSEVKSAVSGDTVDGFACEYVTMPATAFTVAPVGYSDAEAATLPCAGLTAWTALVVNGHVKPGDIVLTQGTGGVSLFALQFAKAAGARVISTSSSDQKLERLKALGAEYLVNYRTEPEWGKAVFKQTGGRGVDHVIEVGGVGTLDQSVIACRPGGHIALIGVLTGYSAPVAAWQIMRKQIAVRGLTVGNHRQQRDMIRGIDSCRIRPVIDTSFDLERLPDAFRYQESNRHFGKICIAI